MIRASDHPGPACDAVCYSSNITPSSLQVIRASDLPGPACDAVYYSSNITPSLLQVIRASDLPGPAYDAFGYSLSGGLDMDSNGYPDLLTSSFCSDRVVLIRWHDALTSLKNDDV